MYKESGLLKYWENKQKILIFHQIFATYMQLLFKKSTINGNFLLLCLEQIQSCEVL